MVQWWVRPLTSCFNVILTKTCSENVCWLLSLTGAVWVMGMGCALVVQPLHPQEPRYPRPKHWALRCFLRGFWQTTYQNHQHLQGFLHMAVFRCSSHQVQNIVFYNVSAPLRSRKRRKLPKGIKHHGFLTTMIVSRSSPIMLVVP